MELQQLVGPLTGLEMLPIITAIASLGRTVPKSPCFPHEEPHNVADISAERTEAQK